MKYVVTYKQANDSSPKQVGGKFLALSRMANGGLNVPEALCVPTEIYRKYVSTTGLRNRIEFELHRKLFEQMRWEEIWDTALRIRNMFMNTPLPKGMREGLIGGLKDHVDQKHMAVRSSAPGEDAAKTSFAGLHESFVNVCGIEAVLDSIRMVWASLWSDRALLYRRELGLDVAKSVIAVVVQEMVIGSASGVVFGQSPVDDSQAVVEAVYGLNQGLVDGVVDPDRWVLERETGRFISHAAAQRVKAMRPAPRGVTLKALDADQRENPPLGPQEINQIVDLAMRAERLFGSPQDVEWTISEGSLYALQSRPITTGVSENDDERRWYLSLHRSLENLKELREKIENELIPDMINEAGSLAQEDLSKLSDEDLARKIEARERIHEKWLAAYRRDCIPFAHGMRLFGQIYNDAVHPTDPFEFMDLLSGSRMLSVQRNRMMEELASRLHRDPQLAEQVRDHRIEEWDPAFREALQAFNEQFGDLTWGQDRFMKDSSATVGLLLQMASGLADRQSPPPRREIASLEEGFLSRFPGEQRQHYEEVLDLARASYRLRDDDNIYLGKIDGQVMAAVEEGRRRIAKRVEMDVESLKPEEVVAALKDPDFVPKTGGLPEQKERKSDFRLRARQLVGQPAGAGIAVGKARVVLHSQDLLKFEAGEILVCDSVDPNMTLVVPLAAGIVERRGGMLIHGAIIAREYGVPCVTGVPDVTKYVATGGQITVDGFLGIVIIGGTKPLRESHGD